MSQARVATAVEGLDGILGGGLPADRLYLVEGLPGSGKTTLALQFLREGARLGEPVLYVALSETNEELTEVARSHGWKLDGVVVHELSSDINLQPDAQYTVFHPSEVELGATMKGVTEVVERVRPRRIVIDSLSELRLLAGDPLRYRRQILALKQFLGAAGRATVLLLDDKTAVGSDLQLQSLAHGVIALEQLTPEYGGARRRLRITKVRGVRFQDGYHDYEILHGGLRVYPRLVAAEHGRRFEPQSMTTGLAALDTLLGGGIARGTTTLLMGPAGSGKSLMAAQVASAAAARGEGIAFFLFDEGIGTFLAGTAGIGLDMRPFIETGRVIVKQIDPAELSPGQFVHLVRHAVEKVGVGVVVIDSLNGYLNAMPEERLLTTHLHELFAYLGQHGILTLTVMAQHGLIGNTQVPLDITYLADTVVLLRYFEAHGAVRKAISVMKRRAGSHESTIREFRISASGIDVGEPLREFRGILTGVPVYEGPAMAGDDGAT
jgi:circadian clock protein KaiC